MSDVKPPDGGMGAHGFDALLPAEMAQKAEQIGAQKTRQDVLSLFVLAILAGAFIALGAMFATTVLAGADGTMPYGIGRLLAGIVFCLGLILVIVGGAELFTGNTLIVMAWAAGEIRLMEMLRVWLIAYVGNFVGAVGTAILVFLSGQYLADHGSVGEAALRLAVAKVALPWDRAFFLGVLCNVLVCLAVWLSYGARTITDKAFGSAGFLASRTLDGVSLDALTWSNFLFSLVPVTVGNIVGGGVLVGAVYWFIYLRPGQLRTKSAGR
jgi:formate transporter